MNKKICIIEDDQDLLEAISISLQEYGFEVFGGTKSSHVQKQLDGSDGSMVDLFILDLFLSGENGKDISLKIKSNPHTQHIPVIIMSATPELPKYSQQAQANAYISKPFNIEDLSEKITTILTSNPN